jgi:hypothetical protein
MVTSSMSAGAARRTSYFNGTSWSLVEMTDAAFGDIPYPVTSEPYIQDVGRPAVFLRKPGYGASCVRVASNVIVEVWDTGTGVKVSSVVIKVNGVVAWTGDAQQTGFAVTKTVLKGGGLRYDVNPNTNFKPNEVVGVEVYVEDLETPANTVTASREFSTGAWK